MAARLGLSPDLRLGQGSPSQPPSGLAPSVSGAGTSRSRSKERRQAMGVLDPLAEVIEVTPGSQADPPVPQEQAPVLAIQEVDSPVIVMTPGQAAPSAPRAPEAEAASESAAGHPSAAPAGTEAQGPRGLLAGTIGLGPERVSIRGYLYFGFSLCALISLFLFLSASGGRAWPVWPPGRPLRWDRLLQPVPRRAMPVGWPPQRAPSSGGPRRRDLPWGKPPRLTPLSGRPSCRGRPLTRPQPRARLTCCRCRHRLLPGPLLIHPRSHPLPLMSGWPRRRCPWFLPTSPFLAMKSGRPSLPRSAIGGLLP
jgi:hypothetical protein